MTRSAITFLFCVCASFFLRAQEVIPPVSNEDDEPRISFDSLQFNFGTIRSGHTVSHEYKFKNTGKVPLVILSVTTGSSGFNSRYPKEPIAPGQYGAITITYYSEFGLTGYIDRTFVVKYNRIDGEVTLHLKGQVDPKYIDPKAPIMKFDSTTYWFDTVYQGTIVDADFRFTNKGKTPLVITNVTGSSGSVCPSYPKEPIAPGQTGVIKVVFHTGGKMGHQEKSVTVTSNATEPNIVLKLKGIVVTPKPPIQPVTGAMISFDTANFNFGSVTQGDTVYHDYRFTNTGKEPLLISSVLGNGGGAAVLSYPHEPIAPGKSGIITIGYITGGTGFHDKSFIITSNNNKGDVYIHMTGTVLARSK